MDPVLVPKHKMLVCVFVNVNGAWGCVMVAVTVVVQPFASVTVTV